MYWDHKGFTLIELMVVIAVVAVLVALIPMLTSGVVVERQMYAVATQLQQDLLRVQNLAATYSTDPSQNPNNASQRKFEIYFDTAGNRYYVENSIGAVFNGTTMTTTAGNVLTRQLSSAVRYTLDAGLASSTYIVFSNQGIPYPSSGGDTITLTNAGGDKIITVTISPIGRISVDWQKR